MRLIGLVGLVATVASAQPLVVHIERGSSYSRAEVSAQAKTLRWKRSVESGELNAYLRQGDRLVAAWRKRDGGIGSLSQTATGTVGWEATLILPDDGSPSLTLEPIDRPPEGLRISLVEADDASGDAVFEFDNQTSAVVLLESTATEGARWQQTCVAIPYVGPFKRGRINFSTTTCPSGLPPGTYARVLFVSLLGAANKRRHLRLTFPFSTDGGAGAWLFPESHFEDLKADRVVDGEALLVTAGDEAVCACTGLVIGRERLRLVRKGRHFCGAPLDGGTTCEWLSRLPSDVGDFAPFYPEGFSPR